MAGERSVMAITENRPPLVTKRPAFQSWLNLFAAFCNLTVAFPFGLYALPVFYPVLARTFRWNHASVAAGGSIIFLLIGVLSPVIGWLVDKYTAKTILLFGMGTVAVGLALLSFTTTLWNYYLFCGVLGLGTCAVSILPNSILIAPRLFQRRGIAVGIINAGIGLGGFIAPVLAAPRLSEQGISRTFLFLSLCIGIPFFLTLLMVKSIDSRDGTDDSHGKEHFEGGPQGPVPGALLRMPLFWIFGLCLFLSGHAMVAVQQHLVLYLTGQGIQPHRAALALGVVLGMSAFGKILNGAIVDVTSARLATLIGQACIVAGIAVLLVVRPSSSLLYLFSIVFGLGYGAIFNVSPLIVFEHFGTRGVGTALGLLIVFFGLGTSSGGLLAGYIYDHTHRYNVAFGVDLAIAASALLLLLLSSEKTRSVTATNFIEAETAAT